MSDDPRKVIGGILRSAEDGHRFADAPLWADDAHSGEGHGGRQTFDIVGRAIWAIGRVGFTAIGPPNVTILDGGEDA